MAAARTAYTIAGSRDLDDKKNRKTLAEIAVRLGDALRIRGGDGDNEEARVAYQRALDLGTKRTGWVTLGLGWVAVNLGEDGDRDRAIGFLERAATMGIHEFSGQAEELLRRVRAR